MPILSFIFHLFISYPFPRSSARKNRPCANYSHNEPYPTRNRTLYSCAVVPQFFTSGMSNTTLWFSEGLSERCGERGVVLCTVASLIASRDAVHCCRVGLSHTLLARPGVSARLRAPFAHLQMRSSRHRLITTKVPSTPFASAQAGCPSRRRPHRAPPAAARAGVARRTAA